MKKRLLTMLLAGAMCVGLAACGGEEKPAGGETTGIYTPGTYTAEAQGYGGAVKVTVTVDANNVTDVSIEAPDETKSIGGAAVEELTANIKKANGGEIDGVAGATLTSTAVKEAAAQCIAQAKGENPTAEGSMTPGTYTASAVGMFHDIIVEVTVDESSIKEVKVTECNDTPYISSRAVAEMPERIVSAQSVTVDSVAGATTSSKAILSAVKTAITEAGGNVNNFNTPTPKNETALPNEEFDIVIVGAGGAGLSAAIQARRVSDHSVLVLERNAMTGGSTALSGGGISVGGAEINKTAVFDFTGKEYADFFEGHTNSLDYLPEGITINRSLVEKIGNAAGPYFDYLTEQGLSYGPVLPMHGFGPEGRGVTGVTATPSAAEVWGTWYTELAEKHGAEIRTNSTVTELLSENGTVTGVKVETPDGIYNVKAKKVILATGGYARDMEMVEKTTLPGRM